MQLRKLSWMVLAVCSMSAQTGLAADPKAISDLPRTYSATAFVQSGTAAGKSFGLTVFVTGWTSDQEVTDFAATLRTSGPNALVSALEKTKDVGRVAPTGSVGAGFRFSRLR